MDSLKISAHQVNREVNPNQRTGKQRDEGFVAASLAENKEKNKANAAKHEQMHGNTKPAIEGDRSGILVEQRKQEMVQQLAEKEKAQQQLDKAQELSLQRQIEERAAANKQKLKGSYAAVQQSDSQQQVQETKADKNRESHQDKEMPPDPINLVV